MRVRVPVVAAVAVGTQVSVASSAGVPGRSEVVDAVAGSCGVPRAASVLGACVVAADPAEAGGRSAGVSAANAQEGVGT